jgi:2-hydroxymuconate-semialdehyde hydrolase
MEVRTNVTQLNDQMRSAPFGSEVTAYLDQGSGPPLLLLHGSGPGATALSNWAQTIPALSDVRRTIAMDLAGFGGSSASADTPFDAAAWGAQAFALMDHLGLGRFSIVGNSLGGRIAIGMALAQPQRIDRLVLMGSGGLIAGMTPGLRQLREYEPSLPAMTSLIRDCFLYDPALASDALINERYEASVKTYEHYRRLFVGTKPVVLDRDALQTIRAATLLIHGREDKIVPPDNSVEFSRLLPNADLHIFARCGHWAQFERRNDFNPLVREFLTAPK